MLPSGLQKAGRGRPLNRHNLPVNLPFKNWPIEEEDYKLSLIDWISDTLFQGYTNLQSLVKITSFTYQNIDHQAHACHCEF